MGVRRCITDRSSVGGALAAAFAKGAAGGEEVFAVAMVVEREKRESERRADKAGTKGAWAYCVGST